MRLLDFPCGRRAASTTPAEDGRTRPAETASKAAAAEKRRRRAELPLWRPSLQSISEDGAAAAGPPAATKSCGEGRPTANAKPKPKPKPQPQAVKVPRRTAAGDGHYKYVNLHELESANA